MATLVAFSGTVIDDGVEYTEPGINGFGESELPDRFDGGDYQVLIVADKYQTGFDEPLLHTMFVDKQLSGIQAVQTLSRLNRTYPGKEDTFVLDFVNTPGEIQAAFQPYCETTLLGAETDLNLIFDLKTRLEAQLVIWSDDVEALVEAFYAGHDPGSLHRYLDPAVQRFSQLPEPVQEDFRATLATFIRVYGFISQIAPFQSVAVHKFYLYGRFLLKKLPGRGRVNLDLDDDVALQYYRLEERSRGRIELTLGESGAVDGITEAGTGRHHRKEAALSSIIEVLNNRFGTEFTEADRLFFDQVEIDIRHDPQIVRAALSNTMENFRYVFDDVFTVKVIERMGMNDKIFAKLMDEPSFQDAVKQWIMASVYQKVNQESNPSAFAD